MLRYTSSIRSVPVSAAAVIMANYRVNKNRNPNTCIFKYGNYCFEIVRMANGIPAMIRRDLTKCIRNEGNLIRFYSEHQINKFLFLTIAFDIEFRRDDFFNCRKHPRIGYVAHQVSDEL